MKKKYKLGEFNISLHHMLAPVLQFMSEVFEVCQTTTLFTNTFGSRLVVPTGRIQKISAVCLSDFFTIYWRRLHQGIDDIFLILTTNTRLLVLTRTASQRCSSRQPQNMFLSQSKKMNVHPCKAYFSYVQWSFQGYLLLGLVDVILPVIRISSFYLA